MGDIADMMLDGTLCEGCGEYIGEGDGFPQYCSSQCAGDRGADEAQVKHHRNDKFTERERRKRQRKKKNENYRKAKNLLAETSNMIEAMLSADADDPSRTDWNNQMQKINARLMRMGGYADAKSNAQKD